MSLRVEYRAPYTPARLWVRTHLGMEKAIRSFVKRNRIKGVRISKDCGELLVQYPESLNGMCDEMVEFVNDFRRVRTDFLPSRYRNLR